MSSAFSESNTKSSLPKKTLLQKFKMNLYAYVTKIKTNNFSQMFKTRLKSSITQTNWNILTKQNSFEKNHIKTKVFVEDWVLVSSISQYLSPIKFDSKKAGINKGTTR